MTELALPAYFFHGIYDYTVNYQLAKDYFEGLKAPLKGFYSFDRSAHSPILEEPEKAQKIMREDVFWQERIVSLTILADEPSCISDLGASNAHSCYWPGALFFCRRPGERAGPSLQSDQLARRGVSA